MKKKLLAFTTCIIMMATTLLPSFVGYADGVDVAIEDSVAVVDLCDEHEHHDDEECITHADELFDVECSYGSTADICEETVVLSGSSASDSASGVIPTVIAATHTHSYTVTVAVMRKATCTEKGLEKRKCATCSSMTDVNTAALGHDMETKTVSASCTTQGYSYSYCKRGCGYETSKTNYTPVKGHDYSVPAGTKRAATCTSGGLEIRKCSRCSSTSDVSTSALGHDMQSKTVPSSCTTQGYTYSYCKRGCGYETSKTNYTPVKGHDYSVPAGTKRAATCTEKGLEIRACSRCSSTTEVNTNALGHSTTSNTVAPSCTTQGYTYSYCIRSGCTYSTAHTNIKAALGHDYSVHAGTKRAATCTEKGLEIRACSRCSSTTEVNTNALGHSTTSNTVAPSCTTQGYTYSYCIRSGCTYSTAHTNIKAALGHDYSQLIGTKRAATCTEDGLGIYKCSRCSSTTEGAITAPGHSTTSNTVAPTCSVRGYTVTKCIRSGCTYSTTSNYKDAIGHSLTTKTVPASCTTQGYSYDYCTRSGCSYKTENKNYTAVLGHDYTQLIGTKSEATCTEKGLGIFKCSRCSSTTEANIDELGHSTNLKIVAPTCTVRGYSVLTCTRDGCDYSKVYDYKDALGHSTKTKTVAPTCLTQGYSYDYCTRSGCTYKTENKNFTPVSGHDYSVLVGTKREATCTEKGLGIFKCTTCSSTTEANTIELGHLPVSTTTEPTCEEDGYLITNCGRTGCYYFNKVKAEDALGHDLLSLPYHEPTCIHPGYTLHYCVREGCDYKCQTDQTPYLGHDSIYKVVEPTCTEQGYTISGCQRECCEGDLEKYNFTEPLGHNIVKKVVEPTCVSRGYTVYYCDREGCEHSSTSDYTDALNHDTVTKTVDPSCATKGYTLTTCQRDGCTYSSKTNVKDALGHKYTVLVGTKRPASCTTNGLGIFKCVRCTSVSESNIKAYGHDIKETVVAPTYSSEGYTLKTCQRNMCNYSLKTNYVPVLIKKAATITLSPNNGTQPWTITRNQGMSYGALPTVYKAGYRFLGWYTQSSGGTKISADSVVPNKSSVTLYAHYSVNKYTVKFDANGGTGAPSSVTAEYSKSATIPSATPTRENYTFLGWSTSKTATTATYSPSDKIYVYGNKTLYAVWEVKTYKVTFNSVGGDSVAAIYIPYNQATYGTLPVPEHSRECFSFAGWYTESSYKNRVTKDTVFPGSNVTLYARWTTMHNASPSGGYVKMPTCTEEGQYANVICSRCSIPLSTPYYVEELGHSYTYTLNTEETALNADCERCDVYATYVDFGKYLLLQNLGDNVSNTDKAYALKDYLAYFGYESTDLTSTFSSYIQLLNQNKVDDCHGIHKYYGNSNLVIDKLAESQEEYKLITKIDGFAEMIADDGPFGKLSALSDKLDLVISFDKMINGNYAGTMEGFLDIVSSVISIFPPADMLYGQALDSISSMLVELMEMGLNDNYGTYRHDFVIEASNTMTFTVERDGKIELLHYYEITLEDLGTGNNYDTLLYEMTEKLGRDRFAAFVVKLLEYEAYCIENPDSTTDFRTYFEQNIY